MLGLRLLLQLRGLGPPGRLVLGLLAGAGLLLVSMVSGSLHALAPKTFTLLGYAWSFSSAETALIYLLGVLGETLLLTSLYLVMPVGRLALRHALMGGVTAVLLWEISRHLLVWYFSTLSFVSVVYGSLATAIVALLSLEVAGMILLLGAQVIAEFERATEELAQAEREKSETD